MKRKVHSYCNVKLLWMSQLISRHSFCSGWCSCLRQALAQNSLPAQWKIGIGAQLTALILHISCHPFTKCNIWSWLPFPLKVLRDSPCNLTLSEGRSCSHGDRKQTSGERHTRKDDMCQKLPVSNNCKAFTVHALLYSDVKYHCWSKSRSISQMLRSDVRWYWGSLKCFYSSKITPEISFPLLWISYIV